MATDADFLTAVDFVLKEEGGYVNNPFDPGGETKYGISKRAYPALDIPNLTVEQAQQIYYEDYWLPSGAATLDMPLALVVLDTAVNQGVGTAKKLLAETTDPDAYIAKRQALYAGLAANNPKLARFLAGWTNRLTALSASVRGFV